MKINNEYRFPVSLSKETFPDKIIADAMIGSATEENKKIRKAYGYRKNATIHYERIELTSEDLLMCLSEGHVVCQLFKDGEKNIPFKEFTKSQKNNINFEAAYVVFVDIDKTFKKTINEFVGMLSLEPTFYYTTYSNLQKDKGLRFRLVYVFDSIVATNPYTYKYITHYINDIIENDTIEDVDDKCNERCSQYFNGTNMNDVKINYESGISNKIYSLSDIYGDHKDQFINGLIEFLISYCEYSSYNVDHIDLIGKLLKQYTHQYYDFNSSEKRFVLASEDSSYNQMYNLSDLYYKCSESLKIAIRECGFKGYDTFMKYNRHTYNYIYRKEYDTWIDDEYRIPDDEYFSLFYPTKKIKDHQHRRINLYERTCLRRVLCPTANANQLLFCMYVDIYKFFDYSDGVLNLTCMVRNVENAMKQPLEIIKEKYKESIEKLKKRNPDIVLKKGIAHGNVEHIKKIKEIKLRIVNQLYDKTKTILQNCILIKEKTTLDFKERTLKRMKKELGMTNSKENIKNKKVPNSKEKCYFLDEFQIQRKNVENKKVPNSKEKCYFLDECQIQRKNVENEDSILNNNELNIRVPNSKENVKNQKSAKLHSIVYSSSFDVDKEKEKEKKYVKDKESAKLHSIVYSSFCDVDKEKKNEDNNEIKDKEDMKEDSFKYDWDWIKDVGEYILNDPFMQSHRGREYAIKIGLIKEVPEEAVKP